MNRVFERKKIEEAKNNADIKERIKVGVVGCGGGAGATFVSTALALLAARTSGRRTAFVQAGGSPQGLPPFPQGLPPYRNENVFSALPQRISVRPYVQKTNIYDALGMDRRFAGREFIDFFDLLAHGENIKGVLNMDENINWALRTPQNSQRNGTVFPAYKEHFACAGHSLKGVHTEAEAIALLESRLVNNITGDFVICDFGSGSYADCKNPLYYDTDMLICVLDPLPSKLLASSALIEEIKLMEAKGYRVQWILNKDNGGINRRELRDFLGSVILARAKSIPLLDEKLFYSAEYNCEIPFARKEVREKTEDVFKEVLKKALL